MRALEARSEPPRFGAAVSQSTWPHEKVSRNHVFHKFVLHGSGGAHYLTPRKASISISLVFSSPVATLWSELLAGAIPNTFMNADIRWKQRFQNFDRAFLLLREALERKPEALSMLEKEGVIQRFEYTVELARKTLKDYLEAGGLVISPVTPSQVVKEAFAAKVITEGQLWIDMLDNRNLLSHTYTYDSSVFEQAVQAMADHYLAAMEKLHEFFSQKAME